MLPTTRVGAARVSMKFLIAASDGLVTVTMTLSDGSTKAGLACSTGGLDGAGWAMAADCPSATAAMAMSVAVRMSLPVAGPSGWSGWGLLWRASLARRVALYEIADLAALLEHRVSGAHLIEPVQEGGVIVADSRRLAGGLAVLGQKIGDAGHFPAGIEALGLGQCQHGDIVGQRSHFIVPQLGGIGNDDHVIKRAADAVVEPAVAGGIIDTTSAHPVP